MGENWRQQPTNYRLDGEGILNIIFYFLVKTPERLWLWTLERAGLRVDLFENQWWIVVAVFKSIFSGFVVVVLYRADWTEFHVETFQSAKW